MSDNLTERLLDPAAGNAVAIRQPGGRDWSYAALAGESGRIANALFSLGVRPGDRVAAQIEKSVQAAALYLACLRSGAVFLPLNPAYTIAEVQYFVQDSEPALVVADPATEAEIRPVADRVGARLVTLSHDGQGSLAALAATMADAFETLPREADDLAAILYTSGTTGRSKGAMLTHRNLSSNAETLVAYWRFTERDVILHALPIFHAHGLFVGINTALMARASMLFLPKFDADAVLQTLPRATVMMGIPTFYTRLLVHPGLDREALSRMRLFISGSAPLLAETHHEWQARTGHRILERYGMTETTMLTSNPYDGERVPGSVGFPLPGVELRIVDPLTQRQVIPGNVGRIEVRGPNVFKGYWRKPEKTASDMTADGFFITGDLGMVDDQGYIRLIGRSKDLVISGGFNVYPNEVEAEIDALPGILESAVVGIPHPDFGEAVTAAVVRRTQTLPSEAEILDALGKRLARYKLPKRILFLQELPRNAMGKVQKNLIREAMRDACIW